MITTDGSAKLLDFGAAREFDENDNKSLSVLLKHGYAPAEQYSTKGVQGTYTDVYALSATIYKAITGVTPDSAMDRILDDKLKPPGKLGVKIPDHHEAAIMNGLAVRQHNRYKTVSELYTALYIQTTSTSTVRVEYKPSSQRSSSLAELIQKNSRTILKTTIILTALVVIGIAVWFISQEENLNTDDLGPGSIEDITTPSPEPEQVPEPAQSLELTPQTLEILSIDILYEGITVGDISLIEGETIILEALIDPSGTETEIIWASSDLTIFNVNSMGTFESSATIAAVSPGTAVLTVIAGSHVQICYITVNELPLDISLEPMHRALGHAILNTTDGINLTMYWSATNRGNRTIFERAPNSSTWMMHARDGDYREVLPAFNYDGDAFTISWPGVTSRVYNLFEDGTGFFANPNGSNYESLTWDFEVWN